MPDEGNAFKASSGKRRRMEHVGVAKPEDVPGQEWPGCMWVDTSAGDVSQ